MRKYKKLCSTLINIGLLGSILSLSQGLQASAFQILEQSNTSLGNFHAGAGAKADDASTAFYNPAGMTLLKQTQISTGLAGININARFQGTIFGQPADAQGGTFNLIPNFHIVTPLGPRGAFGFSVVAPFGLNTSYAENTFAAFAATLTKLEVINISPSIAYQLTPRLSLGLGLDIVHGSGELNQQFPNSQFMVKNQLSGWSAGWHAGLLYQISRQTRVGLTYRSKVDATVSGDSTLGTTKTTGSMDITLPPTTTLDFYHEFNRVFTGLATVAFTQWDTIQSFVLKDTPAVIDIVLPQNFRNTWRFSLGGNVKLTPKWTWQFGLGYDQTPVNNTDRTIRLPDNDHYVLSTGIQYQVTKNLRLSAGYLHVFIPNASININNNPTITPQVGNVAGYADVVGLQADWKLA